MKHERYGSRIPGFHAMAGALLLVLGSAGGAPLASLDFTVEGQAMKVTPSALAVPKGIAGSVGVSISGEIPEGAFVEATLRGPSFPARRVLGLPNAPLLLPPLPLVGDYSLDGLKLLGNDGKILLEGSPSSVPIRVFDEVLVARVTSRPLSTDEILERGIVLDESSFRVVEFEVAFSQDGGSFPVRFPVISPVFRQRTEIVPQAEIDQLLVEADRLNSQFGFDSVDLPPELEVAQLQMEVQPVNFQLAGPDGEGEDQFMIPPLAGLVVIPGQFGFLNQFFSVQVFVENAAPEGFGLAVNDVRAELDLPDGADRVQGTVAEPGDDPLRFARVGADAEIQDELPVVNAGPDGQRGTADDVVRFDAGEGGSAEFLVEGLREGLHLMDVKLTANLEGLTAGPVAVEGRAVGSVMVRNPRFSLAFAHPRTIRTGEPYTASVTLLNTSDTIANLVRVGLTEASISGARLESDSQVELGDIPPGESRTASFRLRAQSTGSIAFSNLSIDSDAVEGRFQLSMGIDERGVRLSPDSIGYPPEVTDLPPEIFAAAERVLGQALGVATAPRLPSGVTRTTKSIVKQRVIEMAEAGQRLRLGDTLDRVTTDLLLDWQGGRIDDAGFDEIVRETDAGREWRAALAEVLRSAGPAMAGARLAARAVDVAGRGEEWWLGSVDSMELEFDGSGVERSAEYSAADGMTVAAPAGEDPEAEGWEWTAENLVITSVAGARIGSDGTGTLARWQNVTLPPGARMRLFPGATPPRLEIDGEGDGAFELNPAPSSVEVVVEAEPLILTARQDVEVLVGRPRLRCVSVNPYENYGTVLGLLFNKPMTDEEVEMPASYLLDNGLRAQSVAIQAGGRVAFVHFEAGFGGVRPRLVQVSGIHDPRGTPLATTTLPVGDPAVLGAAVDGRVVRADGSPAPGVPVTLTYHETVPAGPTCAIIDVRPTQVFTDEDGRFTLDFVLTGTPFALAASDTSSLSPELVQLILSSSDDQRVVPEHLEARAIESGLQQQLIEEFGADSLNRAVVAAQGIDRALLKTTLGSPGITVPVALRFRGRGSVTGTVFASDGVTPEPGAAVNLFPASSSRERGRGFFTDGEGRFAFHGVPAGSFSVRVDTSDGRHRTVSGIIESAGQAVELPVVLTDPVPVEQSIVRGRLLEADGVTPHPGGQVAVGRGLSTRGTSVVGVAALVEVSEEGFWEAEVPVGEWFLVGFSADGRRKGTRPGVTTVAAAPRFADVVLEATGQVRGQVQYPDGRPAAGAIVAGGRELVIADEQGFFLLEGVPIGARTISAAVHRDPGLGNPFPRIASATVEVLPGLENPVVVRFSPRGMITGIVRDALGRPVPGVKVALPVGFGFRWVVADSEGRYRFENLALQEWLVSAPSPPVEDVEGVVAEALDTLSSENLEEEDVLRAVTEVATVYAAVRDRQLGDAAVINPGEWGYENTTLVFDSQVAVADITYLPTGTVSGRVENTNSVPIGAKVRLSGVGRSPQGRPAFRVLGELQTDPAVGTFSFGNSVFPGRFSLQAGNPFFPTSIGYTGTTSLLNPDATDIVLRFPSQRETGAPILGVVLDPSGQPVGADVEVAISFGEDYAVRTMADGTFDTQLNLPAGGYSLEAFDPASGLRGRGTVSVRPGVPAYGTIRLLDLGDLNIAVRNADGSPAPGASLTLTRGSFPPATFGLVADAAGTATVAGLVEGDYSVQATNPTATSTIRGTAGVSVEAGRTVWVTVDLQPTGTIRGRFLESDGSTPVEAAMVIVDSMTAFSPTDADGRFEFVGLPLRRYSISAIQPVTGQGGMVTTELAFDGEEREVVLLVGSLGTVTGVVVNATRDAFVAGAEVSIRSSSRFFEGRSITTGPDGSFTMPGVPEGVVSIGARDPNSGLAGSVSAEVTGGETVEVRIELEGRATLPVRVVDDTGSPVIGAAVRARGMDLMTDDEGRAVFVHLPLGEVVVTVNGAPPAERSMASYQIPVPAAGVLSEVTVTFAGDEIGTGTVEGILREADGTTPVPGAEVRLESLREGVPPETFTVFSGADGSFRFEHLGLGGWTLMASAVALAASEAGELEADGEVDTVDLVLGASGTVRGRLVRPDGQPVAACPAVILFLAPSGRLGAVTRSTTLTGQFEMTGIPAGNFTFECEAAELDGIARMVGEVTANGEVVDLGDVVMDFEDPSVIAVLPEDGATRVEPDAAVLLEFSEEIDPGSVTPEGAYLSSNGITIPSTLTVEANGAGDANHAVRIQPLAALGSEATIDVVVIGGPRTGVGGATASRGPSDLLGRHMSAPFQARFTTRDSRPPLLVSLTPVNGASQVDPRSVVRATFDEPIDPAGITVVLNGPGGPVSGAVSVGAGNLVVAFVPDRELPPNTLFDFSIDGVADFAGNPLAAQPLLAAFTTFDTLGPEIAELRIKDGVGPAAGANIVVEAVLSSAETGARYRLSADLVTVGTSGFDVLEVPFVLPASGDVLFRGVAIDHFGNEGPTAEFLVSVQANAPPELVFTRLNPPAGSVATGGPVTVRISATDDSGIADLRGAITGAALASLQTSDGADIVLSAAVRSDAGPGEEIRVLARATDTSGDSTGEVVLTIPIEDGTAPTLAFDGAPPAGEVAPDEVIQLPVRAQDNFGVARYEITAAGAFNEVQEVVVNPPLADDTRSLSFTVPTNAPVLGDGFTLTVRALDEAGLASPTIATTGLRMVDLTPPEVVTFVPAPGSTIPTTRPALSIAFTEALDPASVTPASARLELVSDGSIITTVPVLDPSGEIITLTPAALPLLPGTVYRLVADTGLADPGGNQLMSAVSSSFTTPEFLLVEPLANAEVIEGQSLDVTATETFAINSPVRFTINGVVEGPDQFSPPYTVQVTVPALAELPGGVLPVRAEARDLGGLLLAQVEVEVVVRGLDEDSDGDGLLNGEELAAGSDPFRSDADEDPDGDDLTNAEEVAAGTDANDPDSDDDMLNDGAEVVAATDPLDPDSDDDDLLDGLEGAFGTDPLLADTDGDNLTDGFEVGFGRYWLTAGSFSFDEAAADAGTRGGHLVTIVSAEEQAALELVLGSTPEDASWIGYTDRHVEGSFRWITGERSEFQNFAGGTAPQNTDSDGVVLLDGEEWEDRRLDEALPYILEIGSFTDPTNADSDGDAIPDDLDPFDGPANRAPVATPDSFFVNAGEPLVIVIASELLDDDSDPDGDPFEVESFTQPTGAAVTRPTEASLLFAPDPGFQGLTSFAYTLVDAGGLRVTATVEVTVGANTRPVAGWPADNAGKALWFDNDVVELPASILDGATDLTMQFWMRNARAGLSQVLSGAVPSNLRYFSVSLEADGDLRLRDGVGGGGQWPCPEAFDDDWHHFALVRRQAAGELELFVDGVSKGVVAVELSALDFTGGVVLLGQSQGTLGGNFNAAQAFFGLLEEVAIWHRSLSPDEIALAARGIPSSPELAAFFTFDGDPRGFVNDRSGFDRHGTMGVGDLRPGLTSSEASLPPFQQCELAESGEQTLIQLVGSDAEGNPLTARVLSLPGNGRIFQYVAGAAGVEIVSVPAEVIDPGRRIIYQSDPGFEGRELLGFEVSDGQLLSVPARLEVLVEAGLVPSGADLWDIGNGASVTATSLLAPGTDPGNAFDGTMDELIFADGQGAGAVHFVEWQTAGPVLLEAARLFADDDGPALADHGIAELRLFSRMDSAEPWAPLATWAAPENPYFGSVRAQLKPGIALGLLFRAEFVAAVDGSGPRVEELDGLGESAVLVPSPAEIVLRHATADRTQSGFDVAELIDGQFLVGSHGWAGQVGGTIPTTAVFECEQTLGVTPETIFTFELHHLFSGFHHLGRFRISATTDNREEFADGQNTGGDITAQWRVLEVVEATASGGETMEILPDESVLVGGTPAATTTYTVRVRGIGGGVTGFRLETLEHPSLPDNGPGRASNGNWVLAEFVVNYGGGSPVPNVAPRGVEDSYVGNEDFPLTTGTVLDNDYDPDNDSVSVASFDALSAQGGGVVHDGDGVFAYTPLPGFSGEDSFTYRVTDGWQVSASVTVSLFVAPTVIVRWNNPAGGSWSVASNWTPERLPGVNDAVVIDLPGTYTVTLRDNSAPVSVSVGGPGVTATLEHTGFRLAPIGSMVIESGSTYELNGGTLDGDGEARIEGHLQWTGGTMQGNGRTVLAPGADAILDGNGSKRIVGNRFFENFGTVLYDRPASNSRDLSFGFAINGTGGIINRPGATWEFRDSSQLQSYGGDYSFLNEGLVQKTGAETAPIRAGVPVTNTGTLEILEGALSLLGGATNGGTLTAAAGATLRVEESFEQVANATLAGEGGMVVGGGTASFASAVGLTGAFVQESGTVTFSQEQQFSSMLLTSGTTEFLIDQSIVSLSMNGGDILGDTVLTVTGNLMWDGGLMTGAGRTILAAGATGTLRGGFWTRSLLEGSRVFENRGSLVYLEDGYFVFNSGTPRFINAAGGSFELQGESDLFAGSLGDYTLENEGLLRKTGPGTTTTINARVALSNTGTVEVESGTLQIVDAFNNAGTLTVQTAGVLQLSGTFTQQPGATLDGDGEVRVTGGTVDFPEPLALAGTFTQEAGTVTFGGVQPFSGYVLAGGRLSFSDDQVFDTFDMSGGTLEGSATISVTGTLTWTGGSMAGDGRTVLEASANGTISGGGFWSRILVGAERVFENRGVLIYSDDWFGLSAGSPRFINAPGGFFEIQGEADFRQSQAGDYRFENAGLVRLTGGGTTRVESLVVLENTGTIELESGILELVGGGSNSGTITTGAETSLVLNGTFSNEVGGVMQGESALIINGGTATFAETIALDGEYTHAGGTATFSGEQAFASVLLDSGRIFFNADQEFGAFTLNRNATLDGSGTVTVNGAFDWTGGDMDGTGRTVVAASGSGTIRDGGFRNRHQILDERVFENRGSLVYSQDYMVLRSTAAVPFLNAASGTIEFQGEAGIHTGNGGPFTFENQGLLRKTGQESSVFYPNTSLINNGTIEMVEGTVEPQGDFTQAGILAGTGTILADFFNSGTIRPDSVPGGLIISGDLSQGPAGIIELVLADRDAALAHQSLTVTGGLNADGTLTINLVAPFAETLGASFPVIGYGAQAGSFATVHGLSGNNGYDFDLAFNATALELTVDTEGSVPPSPAVADPDRDRCCSLLERFMGTNPFVPEGDLERTSMRIVEADGERFLEFRFRRAVGARDWPFRVEVSNDLVGWRSSEEDPGMIEELSVTPDGGEAGIEWVAVRVATPLAEAPILFARLAVLGDGAGAE